jgi:hypothetical protein
VNVRHEVLRVKSHSHPAAVHRAGNVVVRDAGAWTPTVHALLRHLEAVGFAGAPRVVGSGSDAKARETLSYVEGGFVHPGPWALDGAASVGVLLRQLHTATASFRAPPEAVWYPWFGRALGGAEQVRARQPRAIADGYGLSAASRRGLVDRIIEFTVHDAADEADLAHITAETTPDQLDPQVPWALAWRVRAAAWQLRHRKVLERGLA